MVGGVAMVLWVLSLVFLVVSDYFAIWLPLLLIAVTIWLAAGAYFVGIAVAEARRNGVGGLRTVGRGLRATGEYVFYWAP